MSPISSDTIMIRFSFRTTRPSDTVPIIGLVFHGDARATAPYVDNANARLMARLMARLAIGEADLVLFVLDVREGLTAIDRDIAELLRRSRTQGGTSAGAAAGRAAGTPAGTPVGTSVRTPVLVVANKADGRGRELLAHEFYELGLGDPWVISALHGTGSGDLLDAVVERLPPPRPEVVDDQLAGRIAILGRPNVGKSSLLNAVIGDERSLVAAEPGTTRDPVDTRIMFAGKRLLLVDTAGIRRHGLTRGVEQYSLLRGLRAMERAGLAIVV